ncbi:MAG TPA: bacillithiol biosynthesis deacetylase BshB1 [Candidatus Acidoferrales bacterium]|nr:bacillithiol biosynthesis deacetylase BshB1 [Candidatus Acidoferrales bacterium]
MKLDLLAIAAHPDDAELTCGGTLIKMAQMGYKTGVLDLTRGEMGTRGTPEMRLHEAARAAQFLRLTMRANLGLPDAHLEVCEKYKLAVAAKIREWQPRTVILPYWEGRHPDHYNASKLGYEGCFLAGLKQLAIPGEAFRPFKILYSTAYDESVRPSFAVDITEQFEQRRRAILAYESQFRPKKSARKSKVHIPLDTLEERMSVMSRYYGRMIGARYAEPFIVREVMGIDDVVEMPVRSI